ncbi:hypothetical protein SNEBB_009130 [Seison nebaliae]|nr:hypothetical protein SNEBB_009130 [Seison nebaliae]
MKNIINSVKGLSIESDDRVFIHENEEEDDGDNSAFALDNYQLPNDETLENYATDIEPSSDSEVDSDDDDGQILLNNLYSKNMYTMRLSSNDESEDDECKTEKMNGMFSIKKKTENLSEINIKSNVNLEKNDPTTKDIRVARNLNSENVVTYYIEHLLNKCKLDDDQNDVFDDEDLLLDFYRIMHKKKKLLIDMTVECENNL